jgi:hypothetical protein
MLTRLWKSAGSTRIICGLFAVAVILCLTSTGFAQSTASEGDNDAYRLGYYGGANFGFPAAEVNIVNPGSTGGYSKFDPNAPGDDFGDLCANIYVFTADQEMVECCSCFISPNGLRTLNIDVDLTANPLTSTAPHSGLIKIVSSDIDSSQGDGACSGVSTNPAGKAEFTDVAGAPYEPEGSLRTWSTHIRPTTASLFTLTEASFRHADLGHKHFGDSTSSEDRDGTSELRKLQQQCHFIALAGSGKGHCTCGVGD